MRSWLRDKNKLPASILAERQLGSLLGICSRSEKREPQRAFWIFSGKWDSNCNLTRLALYCSMNKKKMPIFWMNRFLYTRFYSYEC